MIYPGDGNQGHSHLADRKKYGKHRGLFMTHNAEGSRGDADGGRDNGHREFGGHQRADTRPKCGSRRISANALLRKAAPSL